MEYPKALRVVLSALIAAGVAINVTGCAQNDGCYDQQSCFYAAQARQDRGNALIGIGAGLMSQPAQPRFTTMCTRFGNMTTCN